MERRIAGMKRRMERRSWDGGPVRRDGAADCGDAAADCGDGAADRRGWSGGWSGGPLERRVAATERRSGEETARRRGGEEERRRGGEEREREKSRGGVYEWSIMEDGWKMDGI